MEICRLCLTEDTQLIYLLNNKDIIEKIKECISLEISEDDDLPKTSCNNCLQKIEEWCTFKESCLISQQTLLEQRNKLLDIREPYELLEKEDDIKYLLVIDEDEDKKITQATIEIPENTYTCDICEQEFNNCIEYLDHQSYHNGKPVFKCDKCSEVFSSRQQLVQHDRNHKISCPKCGKMILKNSMKLHLVKHTDKHMCSHCSNRFNSKAALQQHIITLHTNQKDHICENCGKRFSSKTAMTVHLKSHSDERLYQCKVCNYAGRTASAVYVHMSTHANEVCICEVCSKIFKSTRNLNDHLRRVHSREKKHECSYCDKKFVDKYMLNVHVRCHTGVRPYICELCDKAFIRSDGLKEHMAVHRERIFYNCNKCDKKFASKKGIARHHCIGGTNSL